MNDFFSKLTKIVDHNRYTVISGIMAVIMIACLVGCEVQTASIINPGEKVTASGLSIEMAKIDGSLAKKKNAIDSAVADYNSEIKMLNDQIDAAQADLARQTEMRTNLFDLIGSTVTAAATGGVTAPGLITTGLAMLGMFTGVGVVADNRRKDSKIKELKAPTVV